eukprot:6308490-Pyramimonas_sp.AAC.1
MPSDRPLRGHGRAAAPFWLRLLAGRRRYFHATGLGVSFLAFLLGGCPRALFACLSFLAA